LTLTHAGPCGKWAELGSSTSSNGKPLEGLLWWGYHKMIILKVHSSFCAGRYSGIKSSGKEPTGSYCSITDKLPEAR